MFGVEAIDDVPSPLGIFPRPGDRFLHFELVEEIGSGSFARVFLARQESLSHRLVVLKLTTTPTDEPQKLARLQHTNVVPVYSVHDVGSLRVLCMPFFGRVTLSQVIADLTRRDGSRKRTGRELFEIVLGNRTASSPGVERAGPTAALLETLEILGRLSFVEASLWFVGQLAAGLAHAHARHILHRDLKPANVLITADGVPMLLDFNVSSESVRSSTDGVIGGTLPYMAPEHLRAFAGEAVAVDERSDLYSLGVILYELLTGRYPYPVPDALSIEGDFAAMIDRHRAPPAPPSRHNPAISPAVDAIVLKLLDSEPGRRYADAAALREDLTRQLAHRPLKYARNGSPIERIQKWRRRNPGLAVAALAFFALVLPSAFIAVRQAELEARYGQLQRAELDGQFHSALSDLQTAEELLGSRSDPEMRGRGLALAKNVFDRFALDEGSGLESNPGFALQEPSKRAELKSKFGEILILMARAEADGPGGTAAAKTWNRLAGRMFDDGDRPSVIDRQREEFELRGAGKPIRPFAAPDPINARPMDLYFDGMDLAFAGRPAEALPLLARYCDGHPSHYLAWFARGMCHDALNRPADAVTAFAVCVSLRPESPYAHANRGLSQLKLRRYAEAEADFSRTLNWKPDWWLALLNRGLAREGLRKYEEAERDLTAAMADPDAPARLFFLRSRVRRAAGHAAGAEADRQEGFAREPKDALSWSTRGTWRMAAKDYEKALADFDAALAINPESRDALLNKAIVLADHLHREADAIPLLDQFLNLSPEHVDARCSRGVYAARIGRAPEARRDADEALKLDGSAFRLFQVAGLYAQLSKADPTGKAKDRALGYLARSIQAGFVDHQLLKGDTDLEPIRGDPKYRDIVAGAEALQRLAQ